MANFDLLSVGDASFDVFLTPTQSESLCQMNDKESLICFGYGAKIPVKELEFTIGGNAANNAVGVRRLGVGVSVVLTLAADETGAQIIDKLETEGVDTSFVVTQVATQSNYSLILSYSGERTAFTYSAPRSYAFPVKIPATPWVYLTSMGDTFMPFYNHLIDFLKVNPQVKLAFNPGSRQVKAGYDQIKDAMNRTDIIFVNREEAESLTGISDSHGKDKELLQALTKLGPKHPVVTDGGNGVFCFDGAKYLECSVLPVDPYEKTGAGDAFGSGCLSAIIKGKGFDEALIWGTVNSASVIGYTGAQKGLLKENEMPIWVERAKSSGVGVVEF